MKWDAYTLDVMDPVIHVRCLRCLPDERVVQHLEQTSSVPVGNERRFSWEGWCTRCGTLMRVEDSVPVVHESSEVTGRSDGTSA